jgi:hypothetical protein
MPGIVVSSPLAGDTQALVVAVCNTGLLVDLCLVKFLGCYPLMGWLGWINHLWQ